MSTNTNSPLQYFVFKNGIIYIVAPCFMDGSTAPQSFNLRINDHHVVVSQEGDLDEQYPLFDSLHEAAALVDAKYPNKTGCFVDENSLFCTISNDIKGGSNAPYHVLVKKSTVYQCGSYSEVDGYEIDGEYDLHPSMQALASEIYPT